MATDGNGKETIIFSILSAEAQRAFLPRWMLEDVLGLTAHEQKEQGTSQQLTTTQLLTYVTHLRRMCSYSSHLIGQNNLSLVRIPRKCHRSAVKLREVSDFCQKNPDPKPLNSMIKKLFL